MDCICTVLRKTSKTVVQSLHCLDQQTNDTEIILEMETTFREVSSDNDNDTIYSNAYSNEVDTVMEPSSNNVDGTTYDAVDAPPSYPDIVNDGDSESLPSYSQLGDDYSYV